MVFHWPKHYLVSMVEKIPLLLVDQKDGASVDGVNLCLNRLRTCAVEGKPALRNIHHNMPPP